MYQYFVSSSTSYKGWFVLRRRRSDERGARGTRCTQHRIQSITCKSAVLLYLGRYSTAASRRCISGAQGRGRVASMSLKEVNTMLRRWKRRPFPSPGPIREGGLIDLLDGKSIPDVSGHQWKLARLRNDKDSANDVNLR